MSFSSTLIPINNYKSSESNRGEDDFSHVSGENISAKRLGLTPKTAYSCDLLSAAGRTVSDL